MKHHPGQLMSFFPAIELMQRAPSFALLIHHRQDMESLIDATELGDGLRQPGRAVTYLQRPHHRCRLHQTQLERAGEPEQVIPVPRDQVPVDLMASDPVESAIIRSGINPPEARPTHVGHARAERIAQQPEQAKDDITIRARIRDDLGRRQLGLLFQHEGEEDQAVAECARHHDGIETGELIGDQIVVRGCLGAIEQGTGLRAGRGSEFTSKLLIFS
jgi:hypothetical protein